MGYATAESVVKAGQTLVPVTFTAAEERDVLSVCDTAVDVFPSHEREAVIAETKAAYPDLIIIDFTLPDAVNDNADFYVSQGIPFVMGTTGGDRERLLKTVDDAGESSRGDGETDAPTTLALGPLHADARRALAPGLPAVIAANMGKQIVALQAMLKFAAEEFPGAFSGYSLKVVESHQSTKVDTSGTAKDIVASFGTLGTPITEDEIEKVRTRDEQIGRMGVPEAYLDGHAYHTYTLTSDDGTVEFQFQHNVCGRTLYAEGSVDAALFLAKKIAEGSDKKLFDMVDVLHAGAMR